MMRQAGSIGTSRTKGTQYAQAAVLPGRGLIAESAQGTNMCCGTTGQLHESPALASSMTTTAPLRSASSPLAERTGGSNS